MFGLCRFKTSSKHLPHRLQIKMHCAVNLNVPCHRNFVQFCQQNTNFIDTFSGNAGLEIIANACDCWLVRMLLPVAYESTCELRWAVLLHQGALTSVHEAGLGCIACQGIVKTPVQECVKHAFSAGCIGSYARNLVHCGYPPINFSRSLSLKARLVLW